MTDMFIRTEKMIVNIDNVSTMEVMQGWYGLKEYECKDKPWTIMVSLAGDKNDYFIIAEYDTEEKANVALQYIFDKISNGFNADLRKIGE